MNYGTASAITDTSCMRLQLIETSFGGNEFTRLTRTVRWKSNSQGVDWQPTRGVGSRRRAVPSRHPFLFYARNQNMCAHWPSSMQVHGETVRAKRTYTLTLPERPTCRPRSRQLQSLSGSVDGLVDVDRFPALDANAEITPCDPLDRLSGV